MLHRLLLTLLIAFSPLAKAESALPQWRDRPNRKTGILDKFYGMDVEHSGD
jgi:hypothetical protein